MKTSTLLFVTLAAFALGVLAGGVFAGRRSLPPPPASEAGRYQMHTTEAGLFVMDTATGTVKIMGTSGRVGTWAANYGDFAAPRQ